MFASRGSVAEWIRIPVEIENFSAQMTYENIIQKIEYLNQRSAKPHKTWSKIKFPR